MRVLMCSALATLVAAVTLAGAPQQGRGGGDGKAVKVTGCLSGGPSKFTLTNAAVSKTPDLKEEQATGTSGVVTSYELTPRDGVSLAPHAGHRVELTGVVGEVVKPDEAAPRGRNRGLTANLAVTAVRMISPICLE